MLQQSPNNKPRILISLASPLVLIRNALADVYIAPVSDPAPSAPPAPAPAAAAAGAGGGAGGGAGALPSAPPPYVDVAPAFIYAPPPSVVVQTPEVHTTCAHATWNDRDRDGDSILVGAACYRTKRLWVCPCRAPHQLQSMRWSSLMDLRSPLGNCRARRTAWRASRTSTCTTMMSQRCHQPRFPPTKPAQLRHNCCSLHFSPPPHQIEGLEKYPNLMRLTLKSNDIRSLRGIEEAQ